MIIVSFAYLNQFDIWQSGKTIFSDKFINKDFDQEDPDYIGALFFQKIVDKLDSMQIAFSDLMILNIEPINTASEDSEMIYISADTFDSGWCKFEKFKHSC